MSDTTKDFKFYVYGYFIYEAAKGKEIGPLSGFNDEKLSHNCLYEIGLGYEISKIPTRSSIFFE